MNRPNKQAPPPPKRRQRREGLLDERNEALAHLLASEARQRPEVQRFRARWLPDGPIENETVGAWLRKHKRIEPLTDLERPVPGRRYTSVHYADMKARRVETIPAVSKPLEALAFLVETLMKMYRWRNEHEVTHFLLSESIPRYRPFIGGVKIPGGWPGLASVSLECDLSMTPQDVAREFARIRARLLGPAVRVRSLGLRAYSIVRCWSDADWDAARAVEDWNREHPTDQILTAEQRKLFKRDAEAAWQRLMLGSADLKRPFTPAPPPAAPEPEDWETVAAQLSAKHRRKLAWEE